MTKKAGNFLPAFFVPNAPVSSSESGPATAGTDLYREPGELRLR